jgi:uncharacterized protein (DUF2062 family)
VTILVDRSPVVTWSPTIECDEYACREATSHRETCRCRCQGEGHGLRFRASRQAAAAAFAARSVGGFTPHMLAAIDDDEIF